MGEVERRSERQPDPAYRSGAVPKPYEKPKEKAFDPTEWCPTGGRQYWEQVDADMRAVEMRSEPLNYGTLADHKVVKSLDDLAGIEATAKANLIVAMDRAGLAPVERGIRAHWQLVVDGYGFPMPEGFVHPEAPKEYQQEGVRAWKRVVEIASDSMAKFIFVKVWRRRSLGSGIVGIMGQLQASVDHSREMRVLGTSEDPEVVDAEIVEDDLNG